MAVLDVPDVSCFSEKENAIFGAGIVSGIFNNIGVANIDPINKMPFVIHTGRTVTNKKLILED